MEDSKKHFLIIKICIGICLFICADAYFVPLKKSIQIIVDKTYVENRSRRTRYKTFTITTRSRTFDATPTFYHDVSVGDTINIFCSFITQSIQKASLVNGYNDYQYSIGFVRTGSGVIFTSIIFLGLLIFHIFYFDIKYLRGRLNLLISLLIFTLLLFFFHVEKVFF